MTYSHKNALNINKELIDYFLGKFWLKSDKSNLIRCSFILTMFNFSSIHFKRQFQEMHRTI